MVLPRGSNFHLPRLSLRCSWLGNINHGKEPLWFYITYTVQLIIDGYIWCFGWFEGIEHTMKLEPSSFKHHVRDIYSLVRFQTKSLSKVRRNTSDVFDKISHWNGSFYIIADCHARYHASKHLNAIHIWYVRSKVLRSRLITWFINTV